MAADHELMGGKLHVYKRPNSDVWQCSTYLNGRNWRVSTKEEGLAQAKDFAEDWYLSLKGKARAGELKGGISFKHAARQFELEFEAITQGERSPQYVQQLKDKLRVHLIPFFGNMAVSEITPGLVQQYRVHRMTSRKDPRTCEPLKDPKTGQPLKDPKTGKILKDLKTGEAQRPARSTLHHEIITLRHVLKTAERHGWLKYLPDLSPPYKSSPKISHRAWFSPEEYKQLYEATRRRAENPPKKRWKSACEQLHDFVLFMVNTGLRPDEATRIEYRDVEIVEDASTGKTILEISVRGKRGVGYCKSMPGAIVPFERLKKRNNPQPTDRLFPKIQRELLNNILEEEGLKKDREGLQRTAYSLRHTYICLRLLEGADIYQVAKNCRTSVEMIEKFYAAHLKNMIDAAAVNVMKKRSNDRPSKRGADAKRKTTGRNSGTRSSPSKDYRKPKPH
jgi:integrase